eukprot:tig00021582_g22615.t1
MEDAPLEPASSASGSASSLFSFAERDALGFTLTEDGKRVAAQMAPKIQEARKKWIRFLERVPRAYMGPFEGQRQAQEFRKLVLGGIPPDIRLKVWRVCFDDKIPARPEAEYRALVERGQDPSLPFQDQIEKDLKRTFPGNPNFEAKSTQDALRRVLQAYAARNSDIGYCQGLNLIGGLLLLIMREEEAFWMLVRLVEGVMPARYYTSGMEDLQADQGVLTVLVQEKLPALHAHLQALQVPLGTMCTRWLVGLFVGSMPVETTLRVWDCLFLDGHEVLHRVVLAALKTHERALLACRDACDLLHLLPRLLRSAYDPDPLLRAAYSRELDFTAAHFAQLRSTARAAAFASNANRPNARDAWICPPASPPPGPGKPQPAAPAHGGAAVKFFIGEADHGPAVPRFASSGVQRPPPHAHALLAARSAPSAAVAAGTAGGAWSGGGGGGEGAQGRGAVSSSLAWVARVSSKDPVIIDDYFLRA